MSGFNFSAGIQARHQRQHEDLDAVGGPERELADDGRDKGADPARWTLDKLARLRRLEHLHESLGAVAGTGSCAQQRCQTALPVLGGELLRVWASPPAHEAGLGSDRGIQARHDLLGGLSLEKLHPGVGRHQTMRPGYGVDVHEPIDVPPNERPARTHVASSGTGDGLVGVGPPALRGAATRELRGS